MFVMFCQSNSAVGDPAKCHRLDVSCWGRALQCLALLARGVTGRVPTLTILWTDTYSNGIRVYYNLGYILGI